MKNTSKEYLFESMPIPKAVAQMSIPMILSSLVMVFYSLADTYFVGMLNDPVQNAAVTLASPVLLAFNAVNNLFGVGTSSMMSRCLGRKEYDNVRGSSAFGFYGSVFCGILFALVCTVFKAPLLRVIGADQLTRDATAGYMFWTVSLGAVPAIVNVVMAHMVRAEGASLHASVGTMTGCFLNILLDPLFIMPWGLNMGAAGAGCATFLSNCAACLYFMILIYRKRERTYVCVDPRKIGRSKAIVLGILGVGIPASIQNLLNVTGMTILNNFVSGYGAAAVAAMGVSNRLNSVPMQIVMGASQGIMPLVSYNYTSGNPKRMKNCILFAFSISVPAMLLVTAAYYLGAEHLVRLFMDNSEIIAHGSRFLRGFCFGLVFLSVDFMSVGVFQALGRGRTSLIFAILRKIVLEIPALFLFNKLMPLYGLAYAQPFAELILAVIAVFMLRKIFKNAYKAASEGSGDDRP